MAKKEKKAEQGFGKYLLTQRIKEKFSNNFLTGDASDKILISTSVLFEGVHFSMVYFPFKHLGYKSVISAIAGIYSKRGKPENLIVNIGMSTRYTVEDIETIIEGIDYACLNYDLKMADLNIDSSLTGLTLSITATGSTGKNFNSVSVPTATDLLCVTGDLGAAYMGLQLLERERRVFEETGGAQPQLKGFEYVVGRQLKPEIQTDIFDELRKQKIKPTSVRVLKEGLASDLIGLSKRYNLGCRLYHDKIPYLQETVTAGNEFGIDPLISALNGGEDYELLLSFPVTDFEKLKETENLSIVGHFTCKDEGYSLSLQDGSQAELKAQGWDGD
ncbi:MAG TPA: AIR synthase related protein [Bacteroidales bacterium]|nr:AIR synthase related protein [Bacteroidales bacterium]